MADRMSESMFRVLSRFSRYISGLATAFGVMVLVGWAFHIQRMKGIIPGQVAVKANTGICFVLIGIGLWLAISGDRKRITRVLSRFLPLLASFIGLLSCLECWEGWDLGIDQLLFTAGLEDLPGSMRPGLMSPISAADFFLLGIAIAVLDIKSRWGRTLQNLLPAIAAVAAMFGILDFVLDPQKTHTHIAPMTALILFLFSFAVLFGRAEAGLGALLLSTTPGGVLCRRLLPSAIVIPTVIAWLRWRGQQIGVYSDWAGLATMTVISAVLLAGLTVWTALVVGRADAGRSKAEGRVKEASRYTRSLIEASLDPLVTISSDGKITDVNQATERATGLARDQLMGSDFSSYFTEPEKARQGYQQAFTEGFVRDYPLTLRHISGSVMEVLYNATVFRNAAGGVEGVFAAARDITERKQAQKLLESSEKRYRSLVTATAQIVWTTNAQGEVIDDLPMWRTFTGMTVEQIKGCGWVNSLHPGDRERAAEIWKEAVRTRSLYDTEYRLRRHDGEYRNVAVRGVPVVEGDVRITEWIGTCTDITDRKQVQEAVAAERQKFNSILDAIPPYVVLLTPDYRVAFANREFCRRFGESKRRRCFELLFNRTEPCEVCETFKVLATKKPLQWKWTGPDGRHYDVFDFPFTGSDGSPLILEMGMDVTERTQAEENVQKLNRELEDRVQQRTVQLQESEKRVRHKLDSILLPEGDLGKLGLADILDIPAVQSLMDDFYALTRVTVGVVDLQGNVLAVSGWQKICMQFHRVHPETCKNCMESDLLLSAGVAPGEFKIYKCKNNLWDVATPIVVGGQHMGNFYFGQFLFADEPVDYEIFRTQARRYGFNEADYLAALEATPRLTREVVHASMAFLSKFTGLISQLSYGSIKLARSSAQVGRVNEELAAANKELEAFTYSVSHDLRAPLRHIGGFSKILTEEFASHLPPDAQHHLQRIEEGTRRMGLLVDDLLNLGRVGRQELRLQLAGLASMVKETIEELKTESAGREIEWKIGELPYVECDAGLLKQVFQNLLSNALKFTRPRAHALIEVGQEQCNGNPVVYVRDNGVGFSMKYAGKLFGVFQRLHRAEDFEGTGVGLATVQRIIQKHGGRIWAEAELEKGASFYFTLGSSGKTGEKYEAIAAGENHA